MTQQEFINHIRHIIYEEGWQQKKGRTLKSSVRNQQRSINVIARELGLAKLSYGEVLALGFG